MVKSLIFCAPKKSKTRPRNNLSATLKGLSPSLCKKYVWARGPRPQEISRSSSYQASKNLSSDIWEAKGPINDQPGPRERLQSELPWLYIHLRWGK